MSGNESIRNIEYLFYKQHVDNPVQWHTWSKQTLKKAKEENKLLFIHMGYSACHWCGVMNTEIFNDPDIASFLNQNYISILIDREERYDLEIMYMNAIQVISGNTGWPINCFALPDGSPIFGGNSYQKYDFVEIMESLHEAYLINVQEVQSVANEIRLTILETNNIPKEPVSEIFSKKDLVLITTAWKKRFDNEYGGTLTPPKFTLPNSYEFLIKAGLYLNDKDLLHHAELTLDRMAQGAIFDQINGGFFRYSTDKQWRMPRFEKMLCDNVQLLSLYALAYQTFKKEEYLHVVERIVVFLKRVLYNSKEECFYTSVAADVQGKDGVYYMWNFMELQEALGDDSLFACARFGIPLIGNRENRIAPYVAKTIPELAELFSITEEEAKEKLKSVTEKLRLNKRAKMPDPYVDTKVITSFNAFAACSLLDCYNILKNEEYLTDAIECLKSIRSSKVKEDGSLLRISMLNEVEVSGLLRDYAWTSNALLKLYLIKKDDDLALKEAKGLCDYAITHFYDKNSGMFFCSSDEQDDVPTRMMDLTDGAVPSSNSTMAINLYILSKFYPNSNYKKMMLQMISNVKSQLSGSGPYVSNWSNLLLQIISNKSTS